MKKLFIFIGLFICFSISAFSQAGFIPGFVVTHEKDTLYGKVAYLDNTLLRQNCRFIGEGGTVPVNYSPDQLFGYGFTGDRFFVSKEVNLVTTMSFRSITDAQELRDSLPAEKIFLELVVEGAANLYKYSQVVFFVEKDGELYQLYSEGKEAGIPGQSREGQTLTWDVRKYVGVLQFLMSDCPELGVRINRVALKEIPLADLFLEYSQCRAVSAQTFKEIHTKTQHTFMLKGGVRVSGFSFKAVNKDSQIFDRGTFGYPASPHILGLISFANKRLGDNLSFEVGLSWSHYKMADSISYQEGAFNHFHRVDVEYHEIGIPIGINHSFIRPKVTPYLGTGVMFIFNAPSRFDWKWEQVSGDLYNLHERPDNLIKTMQFGGYINGGLEWAVFNNKASLLTELGFHYTNGIISRNSYGDVPTRLQGVIRSSKLAGQVLVGLKF